MKGQARVSKMLRAALALEQAMLSDFSVGHNQQNKIVCSQFLEQNEPLREANGLSFLHFVVFHCSAFAQSVFVFAIFALENDFDSKVSCKIRISLAQQVLEHFF